MLKILAVPLQIFSHNIHHIKTLDRWKQMNQPRNNNQTEKQSQILKFALTASGIASKAHWTLLGPDTVNGKPHPMSVARLKWKKTIIDFMMFRVVLTKTARSVDVVTFDESKSKHENTQLILYHGCNEIEIKR